MDATIVVRGPSSSMPVVSPQESSSSEQQDGEAEIASGVGYEMSGGNADASLVMSEWVKTDDNGWTKVSATVVS